MRLFTELYSHGSILGASLRGHALRNEVISNNIANADVPGFNARRVEFETSLINAIGDYPRNRRVDLSGFSPTVRFQNPAFHNRVDGSNVDIELEMVNLYQNALRYDVILTSVTANSQRLSTVLQRSQ